MFYGNRGRGVRDVRIYESLRWVTSMNTSEASKRPRSCQYEGHIKQPRYRQKVCMHSGPICVMGKTIFFEFQWWLTVRDQIEAAQTLTRSSSSYSVATPAKTTSVYNTIRLGDGGFPGGCGEASALSFFLPPSLSLELLTLLSAPPSLQTLSQC